MTLDPVYFIYAAMLVSIALVQFNRRAASPIYGIINRWLRWGIFATGCAFMLREFEIMDHPYWVLVLIFALIWFLGETLYNWVAIKALSESPVPLFPQYRISQSGEEWPVQPRFLKVREDVRSRGFLHVQSLRAEILEGIFIRTSVFQRPDAKARLQITFLPQTNGVVSMCMSLASLTTSGHRYVTDNMYLPFAGFYPESWLVERKPWKRTLAALLQRHSARLEKGAEIAEPWTSEPLDDMNAHQRELEQLNTELGFLTSHAEREELGKVTNAGRYRVWKELWSLNYLGRSARYE